MLPMRSSRNGSTPPTTRAPHMLTRRTLGTQGLTVSSLGLGLMGMSSLWERNLEPRIIPLVPDVAPIPGTKRRKYLEENVGAADVALSAAEMDALDAALSPEKVPGPRYNAKQAAMVDR